MPVNNFTGYKKHLKFFVKDTIPWEGEKGMAPFYKILLSLSKQPQKLTIADKNIQGEPLNVFSADREKVNTGHSFNLQPWGFLVYDYK